MSNATKQLNKSKAAMERHLKKEAEFTASVKRGLADAKAGRTTPHDQVFEELDARINATLEKLN